MAHTKGPWRIGKYTNSVISDNSNGLEINGATGEKAVKYYGGNLICESVSIENAKLIAAAPDLLNHLKWISLLIKESDGIIGFHNNGAVAEWSEFDFINDIEEVIKKATE